jgi:hypothetical protein
MLAQRRVEIGLPRATPLVKVVLGVMVVAYSLQLVAESWFDLPVTRLLAWSDPRAGSFGSWQLATAFLLQGPGPLAAILGWMMIFFFLPGAQADFGVGRTCRNFAVAWLFSVGIGFPMQMAGVVVPSAYLGVNCFLTALVVIFGLLKPNATILLVVLPVRASWVAWGTGLGSFVMFLSTRNLYWAVAFFGWCGSVVDLAGSRWLRAAWYRFRLARLDRARQDPHDRGPRLKVLEGGRSPGSDQTGKRGHDDDIVYH